MVAADVEFSSMLGNVIVSCFVCCLSVVAVGVFVAIHGV